MFNQKRYTRETILPVKTIYLDNGIQRIYEFENSGWGASVIMRQSQDGNGNPDGHWEIAPQYKGNLLHWETALELDLYDVRGGLNDAQLQNELHKIKRYALLEVSYEQSRQTRGDFL